MVVLVFPQSLEIAKPLAIQVPAACRGTFFPFPFYFSWLGFTDTCIDQFMLFPL